MQQAGLVRRDDPSLLAGFIWAEVHGIATLAIDGALLESGIDVELLTRFAIERLHTGITTGEPPGDAGPR
jgi:hypothetical protein